MRMSSAHEQCASAEERVSHLRWAITSKSSNAHELCALPPGHGATMLSSMDNLRDVRHPVNLSVRHELLAAAREARINLSALLDRALARELMRLKWIEWRVQNAIAIAAYNRHVADHGAFSKRMSV